MLLLMRFVCASFEVVIEVVIEVAGRGDDGCGVGGSHVGERRGNVLNPAVAVDRGCRCRVLQGGGGGE